MRTTPGQRFAERTLIGIDDTGAEERLVVWIELHPGALWVVGRAVNPHLRETGDPRPEDVIFEGYELDDALQQLNEALEDDLRVLEEDRREPNVRPVTRAEIEPHLERYLLRRP
jgi:hypothetical protein